MNRPINSLQEDFAALGLVEMEDQPGAAMDPRQKAMQKKQLKQRMKLDKMKLSGMKREDEDFEDEEDLEEVRLVRRKKLRGAKAAKRRRAAHMDYLKHRSQRKRAAKKPAAIRRRRRLAKMPAAPKGRMRMLSHVELGNLGHTIQSLGETTNTAALQQAFSNVFRYAKSVAGGYNDLIEQDLVSKYVSYPDMMQSAIDTAQEAQTFAQALAEHDEFLSVADQGLMQDHIEELANHLAEMAEVLSDTETAVAIEEGTFDPEIHDVELASDFGVPLDEDEYLEAAEQKYGEAPMTPIAGWGNEPDELVFNVMHPLGITKVGHREKLILAKQVPRETNEDEDLFADNLDDIELDEYDLYEAKKKAKKKKRNKWDRGSEGDLGKFVTNKYNDPYFIDRKDADFPPKR
jgi:hypothetical protein